MNHSSGSDALNKRNSISHPYFHVAQCDPKSEQKFTISMFDPDTSEYKEVDVTDKVIYINAATGIMFIYNASYKNDPSFGYGMRPPGWIPISGAISR